MLARCDTEAMGQLATGVRQVCLEQPGYIATERVGLAFEVLGGAW